ncbi:hypothetical protein EJ02DRAFT_457983, partial [Clathrospora elynae]
MLHYVGVDLGWTLYMLGVLTCPGIFPTVFTILWKRQSKAAAIISPILGMVTGIAVWLGTAYALYGSVTITTTGATVPCVWGTVTSAFSPLPYSVIITLFKPEHFDWADFRKERLAFDVDIAPISDRADIEVLPNAGDIDSQAKLKRWGRIAAIWALATFLGQWVLWPLPMYASKYVFGQSFFAAWLVVGIIWLWGTLLIVIFYPIIDGRQQILDVWRELTYRKSRKASV